MLNQKIGTYDNPTYLHHKRFLTDKRICTPRNTTQNKTCVVIQALGFYLQVYDYNESEMTLKDLAKWYAEVKFSSVPEHCRPNKKFSDAGANELTKSILTYFELKKWKAWRESSEGRFIQGRSYTDWMGRKMQEKGMYIPRNKSNKGAGDISVVVPPLGRQLSIEVKFGKDRQSEDQKKFQKEIEEMGGIYIIVKTWEDFWYQIRKIEEENEKFKV